MATSNDTLTRSEIEQMKLQELKEACRARDLHVSGNKQALQARLLEYVESNINQTDDTDKVNEDVSNNDDNNNENIEDSANNNGEDDAAVDIGDETNEDSAANNGDENNDTNKDDNAENENEHEEEEKDDNDNTKKSTDTANDDNSSKSFSTINGKVGKESEIEKALKRRVREARFSNANANTEQEKLEKRKKRFQNENGNENGGENGNEKQIDSDFSVNSVIDGVDIKQVNKKLQQRKEKFNSNNSTNSTNSNSNSNDDSKIKDRMIRFGAMEDEEVLKNRIERFKTTPNIDLDNVVRGRALDQELDSMERPQHDRSRSRNRFNRNGNQQRRNNRQYNNNNVSY